MRRILAAALAVTLLAAQAAAAPRVLIVGTDTGTSSSGRQWHAQAQTAITGILSERNVEYWYVRGSEIVSSTANDALRRGKLYLSTRGDSVDFTTVVHLGFNGGAGIYTASYRPDQATLRAALPKVPQVYIGNAGSGGGDPFGYTNGLTANAYTGVSSVVAYDAKDDSAARVFKVGEPWKVYAFNKALHSVRATAADTVTRGWRPLLGWYSANGFVSGGVPNASTDYRVNLDYDRPARGAGSWMVMPDTVVSFAITNTYVDAGGVSRRLRWSTNASDSASFSIFCGFTNRFTLDQLDVTAVLNALNLADSVSNGGVWGQGPRQTDVAIHIDDGWKRGAAHEGSAYGGMDPVTDTLAVAATADSLRARRVKFVLGVEIDSLSSVLMNNNNTAPGNTNQTRVVADGMLYDGRWWGKCAPFIHYTPHCHAGTGSASSGPATDANRAQNLSSPYLRPLDIFGRVRGRWAWGSPDSALAGLGHDYVREGTTHAQSDTGATYWLARRAFALLDSTFGAANVDHFGMPPNDDYSSASLQTYTGAIAMRIDSAFAAWQAAGGRGIRYNGGSNGSNGVKTGGNQAFGYYTQTRPISDRLSAPAWYPDLRKGNDSYLLGCGGYMTSASRTRYHATTTLAKSQYNMQGLATGRTTYGPDFASYNGVSGAGNQRFNIYACHVSDLAVDNEGKVTRPGWYGIKYLANMVDIANDYGVTLFRITYPELVQP